MIVDNFSTGHHYTPYDNANTMQQTSGKEMRLMCPATTRKATSALGRLFFHGAVALLFSFVIMQGALSAHAATHENSAIDQCSICHAASSTATLAQAAAAVFAVDYSGHMPRFSLIRNLPSFNIPSYLAGRSPPTSL